MFLISYLDNPKMIEIRFSLDAELAGRIDAWLAENVSPWMTQEDVLQHVTDLMGYFETNEEALTAYAALRSEFAELPAQVSTRPVEDRDWKEAYKEHFHPWSADGLHWVPTWEKGTYPVPEGEKAIYLDPGMAFGTGNHETTRLCALRIMQAYRDWSGGLGKSVLDCGCGSGILAISAAALGFAPIKGFDIDPDSVEIACENRDVNGLQGKAEFACCGIPEGIGNDQADLVIANILSPVLKEFASWLIGAVKPRGRMVLAGILKEEAEDVRRHFFPIADKAWEAFTVESRVDGEWADLLFIRG